MPNIASVLKDEIRRLAKKEATAQTRPLKTASAQYRRDIASLKRVIKEQERKIATMSRVGGQARTAPSSRDIIPARFSPDWVAKHRAKLGLSAADYAALVGVSPLTVYNWEKGKTRPQQKQMAGWASVRKLGKREAWKRLEEMGR